MIFFQERGGGLDQTKSFEALFLPQTAKRGQIQKFLRQFWGSFGAVFRQNFCNISSISKGWNDFTHDQFKDYNVFEVKNLQ